MLILFTKNGLQLRLDKCHFLESSIEYLGYQISKDGIKPSENKIKAVSQFPMPRNVYDVCSFLGLADYFRRFVKYFSIIVKSLSDLTRFDSKVMKYKKVF